MTELAFYSRDHTCKVFFITLRNETALKYNMKSRAFHDLVSQNAPNMTAKQSKVIIGNAVG